nr:NUDIX hydrolase [Motilibacter deserti]
MSSRTAHEGEKIAVRQDVVRIGGDDATYDVVEHPGGVAVVPFDTSGAVLLVRQFRHAVGEDVWGLPMGFRDRPDEDPGDAAARELAEETGCVAGSLEPLLVLYPTPGVSDERSSVFLGRDVRQVRAPEREPTEKDMAMRWWPVDDAVAGILDGRIRCGITIAGLLAARVAIARGYPALRG